MSPKPAKRLISLKHCGLGLAGHYQWEKEILIDYIATRIGLVEEDIIEGAEIDGITHESHYAELCKIAKALRKHAGAGLHAKIALSGVFADIRDFVEWDNEELADYLVHQIVEIDLPAALESDQGNKRFADEISMIAYAIYTEESFDGCQDAEKESRECRKLRDYQRAQEQMRRDAADEAAKSSQILGTASVPFTATPVAPKAGKKNKAA